MSAPARNADKGGAPTAPVAPSPAMIVVGKDVLELLSSAMYVDPLSIYREYVQNAADAIDEAHEQGVMSRGTKGRVDITVDGVDRKIIVRDNGSGIPVDDAVSRLLAIGASSKRGTSARGFRGVGRLAGLAYGRALTFRTRAKGDDEIVELRWDCQRLRAALRDVVESDDIASVIQRIVSISRLPGGDWPEHFFEVELNDVLRTRRDSLLNVALIRDYLEQVAPVPLAEEFSWADEIAAHLSDVRLGNLHISLNDGPALRRPFQDQFHVTDSIVDQFDGVELLTLSDLDGGTAAVGWLMQHGYRGSITSRARIAGVRARVGNVQIGDPSLLEDIFPEARFNGWSVGEMHILDPRIIPNARRDNFEQNIHFSNLTAQLEPLGRRIAKSARNASIARNAARRAETEYLVTQRPDPTDPKRVSEADVAGAVDALCNNEMSKAPGSSSSGGRFSLSQRMFAKKIKALAKQSGLNAREIRDVLHDLI